VQKRHTLADLGKDEIGVIKSIEGDTAVKQRLSSMGLVKGSQIEVEHTSLFGDPRTYQVKGYSICMRKLEAEHIILQ